MKIETAENCSRKLLQYAREREQSKSGIYDSTRDRIFQIIQECEETKKILSELIYGDNRSRISVTDSNIDKSARNSINKTDSIITTYASVLKLLSTNTQFPRCVQQCANMLWEWFEVRILKNYKYINSQKFKCDYRRFKRIIYALVIMYAYHIENYSVDKCMEQFNTWKSELGKSADVTARYATPWQAYQIEIKNNSRYATLTAVVLWDMLLDAGLSALCDRTTLADACIHESGLWGKVEQLNPDVLDGYIHYTENPEILTTLHLVD